MRFLILILLISFSLPAIAVEKWMNSETHFEGYARKSQERVGYGTHSTYSKTEIKAASVTEFLGLEIEEMKNLSLRITSGNESIKLNADSAKNISKEFFISGPHDFSIERKSKKLVFFASKSTEGRLNFQYDVFKLRAHAVSGYIGERHFKNCDINLDMPTSRGFKVCGKVKSPISF